MKKFLIALLFIPLITLADVNQYCQKSASTVTSIKFVNNCGPSTQVTMMAGNYGKDSGKPTCIKNGSGTVYLTKPSKPWGYAFYTSTSGTRFELTVNTNIANRASWDVSANAGWDHGMTVIAPKNSTGPILLVATSKDAPGIYPPKTQSNPCAVQPCASNAWVNDNIKSGFTIYLCNRSGDKNTPGVCGCKQCPGISCNKGDKHCTTSGSGVYCKTICPDKKASCLGINWKNPPSQCVKSCS